MPRATSEWLCGHLDEFRNALVITFDKVGPDGEDSRGALVVDLGSNEGPDIIVEKDFACLDLSDADNHDTFPNPQLGAVC